jgi:ribosomal protein S27E
MARVRVCDRCNKYYPSYETSENAVGLATFNIDNEQTGQATYYDLCPECLEELRSWLFGKDYTDMSNPNRAAESHCGVHSLSDAIRNAIDVDGIRDALSKQEPMVPEGDFDSVPHYRCPTCNDAVVMYSDDPRMPYCQWCGQALDWNGVVD